MRKTIAVSVLAVALAGCGSTHIVSAAPAANVQVCRDYAQQVTWWASIAQPTLSDVAQIDADTAKDWHEALPGTRLAADLGVMYRDEGTTAVWAASSQVSADCSALGVPDDAARTDGQA